MQLSHETIAREEQAESLRERFRYGIVSPLPVDVSCTVKPKLLYQLSRESGLDIPWCAKLTLDPKHSGIQS